MTIMKRQAFFILFFWGLIMAVYSQHDSLQLDVLTIKNPNTNLLNIIDRHIYVMEKRGIHDTNDIVIRMYIAPKLSITQGIPKNIIDSIYCFNDFSNDTALYPPSYILEVLTEHKSSFIRHLHDTMYKSLFYFKYKTLDVFIFSNLSIKMPETSFSKKIILGCNLQANTKYYITFSNNYTYYGFYGYFNYPFEIITNKINNDTKNKFDYFEKAKIIKVPY